MKQSKMAVEVPAKRYYTITHPYGQRIHEQHAALSEHLDQRVEATSSQNLSTPPSSDLQDAKRRRLNDTTIHPPAHEAYPETMSSFAHSPVHTTESTRQEVLPQIYASQTPVQYNQQTQGTKPMIISPPQAIYPHPRQPQPFYPPKSMVSQALPEIGLTQFQNSGVEAVIMSIPVLDKIKILSRISHPLPAPSVASKLRGAIIAIEGMDATRVYSMTNFLAEQLEKEGRFAVKIFGGPDLYSGPSVASRQGAMTTEIYLKLLSEWHKTNQKMVEYITTGLGCELGKTISVTSGSRSSPIPIYDDDQDRRMNVVDDPKTPDKIVRIDERSKTGIKIPESTHSVEDTITVIHGARPPPLTFPRPLNSTRIPPPPSTPLPSHNSSQSSNVQTATGTTSTEQQHPRESQPVRRSTNAIPIALIPRFQLTTVDTSSNLMPISDGLSPAAHWEWFATLWRGIIGPDITIVIKGLDNEPGVGEAPRTTTGPSDAAASQNQARDRNSNAGVRSGQHSGVKIRLNDYRTLIVRTGLVSSSLSSITGTGADGKNANGTSSALVDPAQQVKEIEDWERSKRRIGFEVEEYLRR